MIKLTFGNKKCGCQAIFYVETKEKSHEMGEDYKAYLHAVRIKNDEESKRIFEKYNGEKLYQNWLTLTKELVAIEDEDKYCWVNNGVFYTSLY